MDPNLALFDSLCVYIYYMYNIYIASLSNPTEVTKIVNKHLLLGVMSGHCKTTVLCGIQLDPSGLSVCV